jgi:hypothetical protein
MYDASVTHSGIRRRHRIDVHAKSGLGHEIAVNGQRRDAADDNGISSAFRLLRADKQQSTNSRIC